MILMRETNKELKDLAYQSMKDAEEIVVNDPYRLHYHLMQLVGLVYDPNGFVYFKGQYYIFYQWNSFATNHSTKFWGHYISDELVHWKEAPIALAPDQWFDKNGCYSGSAVVKDDKLILFYTGNVKNKDGDRETYQCMAVSSDGITFEKKGPIIYLPEGYTAHFRDPKVFARDGRWYMVLGAQTLEEKGEVVIFRSDDLEEWTFLGPLAGSNHNNLGDFGYMWECPDLFRLNDQDILIVSPQGLKPDGYLFNNIYQAGYFSGTVDYEDVAYQHGTFTELDRGFDFYAPQTTLDNKGRRLLFAWMGNAEEDVGMHPTTKFSWIHALTLPRELKWENGRLLQHPVEELKQLRGNLHDYIDVTVREQPIQLDGINGNVFELNLTIKEWNAQAFSIQVGQDIRLMYSDDTFTLQRKSLIDSSKIESRHCLLQDLKNIHIFKDTSSIEVFINNGEKVFTSRVYDDPSENTVTFYADGAVLIDVQKWDLEKVSK